MLLTYFLNDFEIVPVAPIITGITYYYYYHHHHHHQICTHDSAYIFPYVQTVTCHILSILQYFVVDTQQ
jgi:hypothetical protein